MGYVFSRGLLCTPRNHRQNFPCSHQPHGNCRGNLIPPVLRMARYSTPTPCSGASPKFSFFQPALFRKTSFSFIRACRRARCSPAGFNVVRRTSPPGARFTIRIPAVDDAARGLRPSADPAVFRHRKEVRLRARRRDPWSAPAHRILRSANPSRDQ